MQILQWLCKRPHEQERKSTKKKEDISDQNAEGKDIILLDHHDEASHRTRRKEERKLGFKNLKIFSLIWRKDIPKACFSSTLNLKRLGSFNRRLNLVYPMKMKREEVSTRIGFANNKTDSNDYVKNKVLHVTEASFSNPETKDEIKRDKKKPVSRMKELVRWAAASKTKKGRKFNGGKVVQFRRRGTVKAIEQDDEETKLSFGWDLGNCSTTSSSNINAQNSLSATTDHITCRKGNWITSDSEFVVLEL